MSRREFYFPPEQIEIADQSGVARLAQQISNEEGETTQGHEVRDIYYEPSTFGSSAEAEVEREIQQFIRSTVFSNLSDVEKSKAYRASSMDDDAQWAVLTGEVTDKDRLFAVPNFAIRVPGVQVDRITISGAGGHEYEKIEPGFFDRYADFGFGSKLEYMQFAGAWLCNTSSESYGVYNEAPSITLPDSENPSLKRVVTLGGDMHGDFRMRQVLTPSEGSINPLGDEVAYAPYAQTASAAGYHSIEKLLTTAACIYVIDNEELGEMEKRKLFEILLSEVMPSKMPEKGSGLYGDFGDDLMDTELMKIEIDDMRLRGLEQEPYMGSIVLPDNQDSTLTVQRNQAGNLEFKNNYNRKGIEFDAKEVAPLLDLFSRIGGAEARTSKSSILHAIWCVQQELLNGTEPGYIIESD